MIAAGLAIAVTLLLIAAGYALGTSRTRGRERALKAALDEQNEKLMQTEHELLRRSSLDPVTELPIQQSLQEFLEREWRRAARDHRPVSLIMIEVDHFRAYNDRMGKPEATPASRMSPKR